MKIASVLESGAPCPLNSLRAVAEREKEGRRVVFALGRGVSNAFG